VSCPSVAFMDGFATLYSHSTQSLGERRNPSWKPLVIKAMRFTRYGSRRWYVDEHRPPMPGKSRPGSRLSRRSREPKSSALSECTLRIGSRAHQTGAAVVVRRYSSDDPQEQLRTAARELAGATPQTVRRARELASEVLLDVSSSTFSKVAQIHCNRLFHRGAGCRSTITFVCEGPFSTVFTSLVEQSLGLRVGAEGVSDDDSAAVERRLNQEVQAAAKGWLAEWSRSRTNLEWAQFVTGKVKLGGFATDMFRNWNRDRGLPQRLRAPTSSTRTIVRGITDAGELMFVDLASDDVAAGAGTFDNATASSYRVILIGLGLEDSARTLGVFDRMEGQPTPVFRWMEALFWDACQTVAPHPRESFAYAIDRDRVARFLVQMVPPAEEDGSDRLPRMIDLVEKLQIPIEKLWEKQWEDNYHDYIGRPRGMTRRPMRDVDFIGRSAQHGLDPSDLIDRKGHGNV